MRFAWDDEKAASNWRKHRVDLHVAEDVFADPLAITVQDRFVDGEERWYTIGRVGTRLYVVVFAVYEWELDEIIRIISARNADPKERRDYERGTRASDR